MEFGGKEEREGGCRERWAGKGFLFWPIHLISPSFKVPLWPEGSGWSERTSGPTEGESRWWS